MLDVLQPGKENLEFRVLKITRADTGENITVANTNELIIINGLENIDEFALLRKKE